MSEPATENPPAAVPPPKKKGKPRGGSWKKGTSGNPGGRPKGLAARVREQMPEEELVAGQVRIAKGLKVAGMKPSLADVMRAREWLTERGWGKAAMFAPVEGGDPLEFGAVDEAIAGVVDELAARREAEAPERAAAGTLDTGPQAGADTATG